MVWVLFKPADRQLALRYHNMAESIRRFYQSLFYSFVCNVLSALITGTRTDAGSTTVFDTIYMVRSEPVVCDTVYDIKKITEKGRGLKY